MASNKNILKKKSFAELVNIKEFREIKANDGTILFSFYELGANDFNELVRTIFEMIKNPIENKTVEERIIPILIRKMFVSDMFEMSSMSDDELVSTMNNLGLNISTQIDIALKELAIDKLNSYINNVFANLPTEEVVTETVAEALGEGA